jgi:hypothetical protein
VAWRPRIGQFSVISAETSGDRVGSPIRKRKDHPHITGGSAHAPPVELRGQEIRYLIGETRPGQPQGWQHRTMPKGFVSHGG